MYYQMIVALTDGSYGIICRKTLTALYAHYHVMDEQADQMLTVVKVTWVKTHDEGDGIIGEEHIVLEAHVGWSEFI